MAVKNHNFRFNEEKEAERKAFIIGITIRTFISLSI